MRDKIISVALIAFAFLTNTSLYAATYCGPPQSTAILYTVDGSYKYCINSSGSTVLTQPVAEVCVYYSSISSNQFLGCSFTSIKCKENQSYSGSGGSAICTGCPAGRCASAGTAHQNSSCTYCAKDYYYSSGNCNACPQDGWTDTGCSTTAPLTNCYLPANRTGDDSTGSYTIIEKCYHSGTL